MYQHIMVTLDGSELSEGILPYVESLVKSFRIDYKITFVSVVEKLHIFQGLESSIPEHERHVLEEKAKTQAATYLETIADRTMSRSDWTSTAVLFGEVAGEIINFAQNNNVDLILMATHGRSDIKEMILGSVAEKVMRRSRLPVLMVRPTKYH